MFILLSFTTIYEEFIITGRPNQLLSLLNAIAFAVTQPAHVNVNEILIRPTEQER
jgi:NADP-dependent 3-hydroxy acid dehydrogenase YdfG